MEVRHDGTALGCSRSPGKNRFVSRTAPSLKLRAVSTCPWCPTITSVEPPPMSHSSIRWSKTGTAWSTPRWMRRASSTPEITSTSTPASSQARRTNSSWFSASRTALVATARTGASSMSAICFIRRSVSTPRWMASGVSRFMSPLPVPSRTISFSLVTTSKRSSPVTRATTRWMLFVPTSMAARVSTGSAIRASEPAARQAGEDALAERADAGQRLVGRLVGVVGEHQVRLDGLVEVARRDDVVLLAGGPGHHVGHPRTGQAVPLQRGRLAVRAQAEPVLEGLGPAVGQQHADREVPDGVVELLVLAALLVADELGARAVHDPDVEVGRGQAGAGRVGTAVGVGPDGAAERGERPARVLELGLPEAVQVTRHLVDQLGEGTVAHAGVRRVVEGQLEHDGRMDRVAVAGRGAAVQAVLEAPEAIERAAVRALLLRRGAGVVPELEDAGDGPAQVLVG